MATGQGMGRARPDIALNPIPADVSPHFRGVAKGIEAAESEDEGEGVTLEDLSNQLLKTMQRN